MTSNVSDLVKVKPLEWRGRYDKYDGGKEYYGHGVFGHWYAVERAEAKVWHCMHHVAGEVVHLGYFTSLEEAKAAPQADYESRILAALTPAEQCFSVKEGCVVQAYERREVLALSGSTKQGLCGCTLAEALTIRSAEEVRREFAESLRKACLDTEQGHELLDWVLANCWGIDTPAPSTDTTPSVAEAAKVLLGNLPSEHQAWADAQDKIDNEGDVGDVVVAFLRALAAQTGGE